MQQVFVTLIGTGATAPTPRRGLASQLVQIGGKRLLVDCGEGTQVALRKFANTSPAGIDAVFLTHFHADHWGGLPFLIKTRSGVEEADTLPIYALADGIKHLKEIFKWSHTNTGYELIEIRDGDVIELDDEWEVRVIETDHAVDSCGFVFVENDLPGHFDVKSAIAAGATPGPDMGVLARGGSLTLDNGTVLNGTNFIGESRRGRKIAISGDTRPCLNFTNAARDAELLIHEATLGMDKQARAIKTKHSTAAEAGQVAKAANVGQLWLTHVSDAYQVRDLLKEAREMAPDIPVFLPRDGEVAEIKTGEVIRQSV